MKNNDSKSRRDVTSSRLINFASRIIKVSEALPKTPAARHLAGQLLRSGTSPALNYGEAQSAESKNDFLHKIKICLKELRETYICLELIEKQQWFSDGKLTSLLKENDELIAIFVASTRTISRKMD